MRVYDSFHPVGHVEFTECDLVETVIRDLEKLCTRETHAQGRKLGTKSFALTTPLTESPKLKEVKWFPLKDAHKTCRRIAPLYRGIVADG